VQKKVERISAGLAEIVAGWGGIETIILGEAAEIGTLDPYFSISLDVYHTGGLPPAKDRKESFNNPMAFDSAPVFPEDRFLTQELPVRIRYQETGRLDLLLKRIEDRLWVYRELGTYFFHRILNGQVLYQRSEWLEKIKEQLSVLSDHFWEVILNATRASISYHLNDLHAAVFRNDNLFYTLALAGFLRQVCSFLFAVNHCFEPPGRMLYEKVMNLSRLPDEFTGRFESLLREDPEMSPDRKREIAELLAKSIIPMV
jgi:hypothetical protein